MSKTQSMVSKEDTESHLNLSPENHEVVKLLHDCEAMTQLHLVNLEKSPYISVVMP